MKSFQLKLKTRCWCPPPIHHHLRETRFLRISFAAHSKNLQIGILFVVVFNWQIKRDLKEDIDKRIPVNRVWATVMSEFWCQLVSQLVAHNLIFSLQMSAHNIQVVPAEIMHLLSTNNTTNWFKRFRQHKNWINIVSNEIREGNHQSERSFYYNISKKHLRIASPDLKRSVST